MFLSAEYWNNRYKENEFGWDTGSITEPLKTYFDQLENKNISILIPGAGNSYEAEYLFNKGFKNVTVVDFAQEPLTNIKNRVPDFPVNNLVKDDFFNHKGQYDLIVEQTFFCAIDPKLRAEYAKHMHSLLKPGGKLVGLLFDTVFEKEGPPFGGNKEEFRTYFDSYFTYKTFAPCYNSIAPRAGRELFIHLIKK